MRHEVTVGGRTLVVDRPYSRKPRLSVGGTELPRDRFGNYLLADEHGRQRTVVVDFDFRHLAPRLRVGDQRVLTMPPLPKGAWVLLAPGVLVVLAGGALGAIAGILALTLAAGQLRRPEGGRARFARAAGVELVVVLAYVGLIVLLRRI